MKLRCRVIAGILAGIVVLGGCGAAGNNGKTSSDDKNKITAEMAEEYVTLANYDGIELVKYVSEVSEDSIEGKKETFLEDYKTQTDITDRAIENGDYVSMDMKEVPEGSEEIDYGTIDIQVGEEEFTEEVDKALIGHKAGETVTVESVYEEEGQEIKTTYTMVVNSVYTVSYPEYTDAFVKENTDYATIAELEESFKEEAAAENEEVALEDLRESALAEVMEASEFKELPQELLDNAYEETKELYVDYAEMFGMELSDMVSEEDLKSEAEVSVQQELIIQSIIKKENIKVDDKKYKEYIKKCMKYAEVETEEELNDYYAEGELEELFLREQALDAVIAKAKVSEEAIQDEEAAEELEIGEDGEELEVDEDVVLEEE